MAPSSLLRPLSRLLTPARLPGGSSARSKFYVREPPNDKPDWLKVGLTLGTSAFLWIYVVFSSVFWSWFFWTMISLSPFFPARVILFQQHNEDVLEYKRRNGLE